MWFASLEHSPLRKFSRTLKWHAQAIAILCGKVSKRHDNDNSDSDHSGADFGNLVYGVVITSA
jgi:hypothetical protein